MKNKILLLRRMQTLEGMLKKMRLALNENNVSKARELLNEILELRQDIESIIEREN